MIGLIIGVAASALQASSSVRVELACPEFVQTRQELVSRHDGWSAGPSKLEVENGVLRHPGRPSRYSTGPGQESAFLVPDEQGWTVPEDGDIWLNCVYYGTKIILSKRVPDGSRLCGIDVEAPSKSATAWCEVDPSAKGVVK